MPGIVAASIGSRRFNTELIKIAGATSLLLALVGVYSISAFSMGRRRREIGIRLTLGATPTQMAGALLAGEWSGLALGLTAGTVGALFVSRGLSSFLFASSGLELRVIVTAAVILGAAAAIASYMPARRAIRADPVAALRAD
jgi:putative ABC transport system permease protein